MTKELRWEVPVSKKAGLLEFLRLVMIQLVLLTIFYLLLSVIIQLFSLVISDDLLSMLRIMFGFQSIFFILIPLTLLLIIPLILTFCSLYFFLFFNTFLFNSAKQSYFIEFDNNNLIITSKANTILTYIDIFSGLISPIEKLI